MVGSEAPGSAPSAEGARDKKRRETRRRIADAGLRLFLANGYDATTLDAIAAEAGISRRAFFSYFRAKDDLLFAWQEAGWASVNADLLRTSPDVQPLDAVHDCIVKYVASYSVEEMDSLDRVMRSIESVAARKQTFYAEQERALFATLCEVWRQPERRLALRMVAMVSMGAVRVATQARSEQPEPRKPITELLLDAFASLPTGGAVRPA